MKEYKFKINGGDYNVTINSIEGTNADVTVNGKSYQVEMEQPMAAQPAVAQPVVAQPVAQPVVAKPVAQPAGQPAAGGKVQKITSPLPGVIIEISVKEGDVIKAGQKVAVIEAMKMENEIQSDFDGTVTAINANKGDSLLEGDPIITLS